MTTIFRYIKDTINHQHWECQLTFSEDSIELWKQHSNSEDCRIIKEVSEVISVKSAEKYKLENKLFLVETYTI